MLRFRRPPVPFSSLGLILLASILAAMLATNATARSSDGGSIASAAPVTSGQHVFGNNSNASCQYGQFWTVALHAGDPVTVDWEASSVTNNIQLHLYQPGVTDFNLGQTTPAEDFQLNTNFKAEASFRASVSGTWILRFDTSNSCNGDAFNSGSPGPGPYDFILYDKRAVKVVTSISPGRLDRATPLTVTAYNLDGGVISDSQLGFTISGYWNHHWYTLSKGTFAKGPVRLKLPIPATVAGSTIRLQVNIGGPNYEGSGMTYKNLKVS